MQHNQSRRIQDFLFFVHGIEHFFFVFLFPHLLKCILSEKKKNFRSFFISESAFFKLNKIKILLKSHLNSLAGILKTFLLNSYYKLLLVSYQYTLCVYQKKLFFLLKYELYIIPSMGVIVIYTKFNNNNSISAWLTARYYNWHNI